ncbi:MAG TPA: hypothetical protein VN929_07840 [Burkholderiales bacterium]|nr:hypothetical protein [Burkholderiales bacterium]
MKKFAAVLAGLLVPAFLVAGIVATPALAQEKKAAKAAVGKPTVKEITSDDKVRVYEISYKSGDGRQVQPGHRVVRALKGGTLERDHPDGKKEKVQWKEGQVRINKPTQGYSVKNVGKTEVRLYIVESK